MFVGSHGAVPAKIPALARRLAGMNYEWCSWVKGKQDRPGRRAKLPCATINTRDISLFCAVAADHGIETSDG
jgi:hypothetical protein